MKWAVPTLMVVLAAGASLLAGCNKKQAVELTPDELAHLKLERYDPGHARAVRPLIAAFGAEEGVGEIVAVDPAALTVSLRHRQESHDDWPSMVMNFRVRRSLIGQLKPGDRIYFRAVVLDEAGEIVDVAPAPGE